MHRDIARYSENGDVQHNASNSNSNTSVNSSGWEWLSGLSVHEGVGTDYPLTSRSHPLTIGLLLVHYSYQAATPVTDSMRRTSLALVLVTPHYSLTIHSLFTQAPSPSA